MAAEELSARGLVAPSRNAVDFLNPHQSILGLWGRAYLKPPFPCEQRLESLSEQLAIRFPQPHSPTAHRVLFGGTMEEAIADEDKDCSLGEGNVLPDMTPTNAATSFAGLSLFSALCVIWRAVGNCGKLKIGRAVHETCRV